MMTIYEAALQYASLGLRCLPVRAGGKAPAIKHWETEATSDPETLRQWFARGGRNIGIATGSGSGAFVLDVDGEAGREWVAGKNLPHTWIDTTPSGGRHYWFAMPEGATVRNSAGKIFAAEGHQGVDIRGDGGQAVVYPSTNGAGAWEWAPGCAPWEAELAQPPQWLLDAVASPRSSPDGSLRIVTATGAQPLPEVIPEGQRNAILVSMAGSMRRRGASESAILAALQVENKDRCRPPLELRDLEGIARSVGRYAPADVPIATATATALAVAMPSPAPPRQFLVDGAEFTLADHPVPECLIGSPDHGSVCVAGELAWWHGAPRSWKSWCAALAALCVATGRPFLGHFPTRQGRVVMVQEEGSRGTWARRLRLCATACSIELEDLRGQLLTDASQGFRLDDPEWLAALGHRCEEFGPDLIIIDPLAATHACDENSATEMAQVIRVLQGIRRDHDCAVVVIHHDRKGPAPGRRSEGMRGSSAIWASGGTVAFTRHGDKGAVVSVELKDSAPVPAFNVDFEFMGEELAVTYGGAALTDSQLEAQATVRDAIDRSSMPMTQADLIAATGLTDTRVREARDRLITLGHIEQAGKRGRALTYRRPLL